ncbi:hypothetical protein E5A73_08025 [Sphingomonas gei]|uniref:Uncharacterized protein n=1 Tax=Sphingomonas gei TaxID=1395960 RepID=A0A4V3QZF6_9SPHN|nr:hypothetical protein [Sphingomonas gei]TGX54062.1 hypothetical protein E5A73_08025 [Sphingomonas gei]
MTRSEDLQDAPVIGWRCSETAYLPGRVRVALHAPVIEAPLGAGPFDPPAGFQFHLYRDKADRTIQAAISWSHVHEDLRLGTPYNLYFEVPRRLVRGESLRLAAPDGSVTRIASNSGNIHFADPGAGYVNTMNRDLIEALLRSAEYDVAVEGSGVTGNVGTIKLFSHDEAASLYRAMLGKIKSKARDPQKYCEAVHAPEVTDESIV